MLKTLGAALAALFLLTEIAGAQTPSGLLTGPVTYTSPLNNSPYGTSFDNPYTVHYVVGTGYANLQASDGTSNGIGNCYTWDVWQLILNDRAYCQTSFHGGGSGETRVGLYCGNATSSDVGGVYTLNCVAGWDGTAITVINGADIPIPTQYNVNVTILHHPVQRLVPVYRRSPQWQTWQAIDSMVVTITPIPF